MICNAPTLHLTRFGNGAQHKASLASIRHHQPDTAIALYRKLIEKRVLCRKRVDYEKVRDDLMDLRKLYEGADQESQWDLYLTCFRKQHARKRLLLQIIDTHLTPR